MSKALISTLVAAAFATSAPTDAHTRELLFGPPLDVKPAVTHHGKARNVSSRKVALHVGKEGPRDITAERAENRLSIVKKAGKRAEPPIKKDTPIAKVAEPVKPVIQAPPKKLDATKQVSAPPVKADTSAPRQTATLTAQAPGKNQGTSSIVTKSAAPAKPTTPPVDVKPAAAVPLASTPATVKPAQQPKVATPVAPVKQGGTQTLNQAKAAASVAVSQSTTKAVTVPAKNPDDLPKAPAPVEKLAIKAAEPVATQTQTSTTPAGADLNKMAANTPVFRTTADDEHSHYQKLQKSLSKGTFIGVLPGLTQAQNLSYRNNVNFFPLTNYLSEKSGFLLTPVYEPSVKDFRRQILEGRYPLIFVSAAMTDAAVKGGYEPLAMNEAVHAMVFVVPAKSGLKTLADLKSSRVAMSTNGTDTTAGLDALVRAGVQEAVTLSDSASQSRAFDEMMKGRFEAAMLSSDFVDSLSENVKGKFRVIATAQAPYSYAYWARKGAYDAATKQRLVSLLVGMNPDRSLDMVREALKHAANLDTKYVALTDSRVKSQLELSAQVAAKWPAFAPNDKAASDEAIARNHALPVFFPLAHPASRGPVTQGRPLQANFGPSRSHTVRPAAVIAGHSRLGNGSARLAMHSAHGAEAAHFDTRIQASNSAAVFAHAQLRESWTKAGYGQIYASVAQDEGSILQYISDGSKPDQSCKTRANFALSALSVAPFEHSYDASDAEEAGPIADSATTTKVDETDTTAAVVNARRGDIDLIQAKWAAFEPQDPPISVDAI